MKSTLLLIPVVAALAVLSGCNSSSDSCNCNANQMCVAGSCRSWEPLAGYSGYGLTDFTPKGATALYVTDGSVVEKYDLAGDAWTDDATGLSMPGGYSYAAWYGDNLYAFDGTTLYTYSLTDKTASSADITGVPSFSNSQTTADTSGNLYALATDGTVAQYNIGTGDVATWTVDTGIFSGGGDEPRAAWDTKTAKVYLADYEGTKLYSLEPTSGTLAPLADFPDSNGMNDAFCSDRQGAVYTSDDCGYGGIIWKYDTATDKWAPLPPLPFEVDCSGSCTVSGDGYLYVLGYDEITSAGAMARIKVF